jgi:hypothetical protein
VHTKLQKRRGFSSGCNTVSSACKRICFSGSSAASEAAPLQSFLSTAANRCISRSWPSPFGRMFIDWLSPLPWVPQDLENTRLGIRNCCKIFMRKGLEVKIFINKDLAWRFWLGDSPSSQTCVNELNNLTTRLCRCCGDGFCFQRAPGQVMRSALSAGPLGTRAQPTSLARSSALSSYERAYRNRAHPD